MLRVTGRGLVEESHGLRSTSDILKKRGHVTDCRDRVPEATFTKRGAKVT